jgi:hypothetical protein
MKWQSLGFIVPSGLMWIFPEFSLVRCARPHGGHIGAQSGILDFASVRGAERANVVRQFPLAAVLDFVYSIPPKQRYLTSTNSSMP